MEVSGKYSTTATANPYDFAANLVGNLLNQLPLTPAELQAAGLQSSISDNFTFIGRSGLSNADGVSAYLNYILLDETFTFVSAGYQMLPDNADASHQQLAMELIPEQDGYVYIYLTNESQQLTDVYFDDFKVTHEVLIKDPQLEAYRYGFNGKEKDSKGEFGLNHYDYGFRIYNPAIAKFLSVDPLTASYPWYTPYQYAGNKPIRYIDLDGTEEAEKPMTVYYASLDNVHEDYLLVLTTLQMKAAVMNMWSSLIAISINGRYYMYQYDVVVDSEGGIPFILERYLAKGTGEYMLDYGLDLLSVIPGGGNVKALNGPIMLAKNGMKTNFVQETKRVVRSVTSSYSRAKHIASSKIDWKDVVKSTKSGPAKFKTGIDTDKLTLKAWENGENVTNGKDWKVYKSEDVIGAYEGKETLYMRVERTVVGSEDVLHAHPISADRYNKLTKSKD